MTMQPFVLSTPSEPSEWGACLFGHVRGKNVMGGVLTNIDCFSSTKSVTGIVSSCSGFRTARGAWVSPSKAILDNLKK